jgi:hypothetical protein
MSQLWDICQPVRTIADDTVRFRYQETTNEGIEEFMCATVTVCKPVRLLELLAVCSQNRQNSYNSAVTFTTGNCIYT